MSLGDMLTVLRLAICEVYITETDLGPIVKHYRKWLQVYLEGYVHGWSDLGAGELYVGVFAEEVNRDHFMALDAEEAR